MEPQTRLSGDPTRRAMIGLGAAAAAFLLDPWPAVAGNADFAAFLDLLWPRAEAQGVKRSTFDAAISGLTPDLSLPRGSGGQPEFDKPLQTYFREAVTAARIVEGRTLAAQRARVLADGEARFGVPGEISLAAWAVESDFGRTRGNRDVVRTLATLAYTRADRPVFRDEFVAALVILERGTARDRLKGSWAGAMGDPQFLPSAYLKYAVSVAGDAMPDIWNNPADIVTSIMGFLRGEGWAPGQPWIVAVVLPEDFECPTLHATAAGWAELGLRRPDGAKPAGDGDAMLFLPSGSGGPAFLLFANYFVIKQYNNSDSYALSLGVLAQRIAGAAPLSTPWPLKPINLSRSDKAFIQARLAASGLYSGPLDGKLGPLARDAIHAYQKQAGLSPADGFATPALLASLRAGR